MTQTNNDVSQPSIEQRIAQITIAYTAQKKRPEFLHLLSKSLPRSGHHHLVGILKQLYGKAFEYCEYYQPSEETCCKQQPCIKFCNISRVTGNTRQVTMQKSHDFDLTDKKYAPTDWLKYVVMTRDFKEAVSSEVKLYLIDLFSDFLSSHRIDSKEILQHHDKKLYREALALIDSADFRVPHHVIAPMLKQRFDYYKGFREKWVKFANEQRHHALLIQYDELVGKDRRNIVNSLIDLIGIPPEVSVDTALAGEPVMTLAERLKEESQTARKLIDANEQLLNYYDAALKNKVGHIHSWNWV